MLITFSQYTFLQISLFLVLVLSYTFAVFTSLHGLSNHGLGRLTMLSVHFSGQLPAPTTKTFPSHVKTVWAESIGLGKCTGWPFSDLEPRLRLWHWLTKICLSAQCTMCNENHTSNHYKTWQFYAIPTPGDAYHFVKFWRNSVGSFFGNFFFKITYVFCQGQTLLAIS